MSDAASLRRVVFGASTGTIFESYDFILFGSLAPLISRHFFSGVNEQAAFIFSLLTFAAGFAIRPFGALLFGRLGDRAGRKKTFLITITIMGLATFAIGLLPGYATAGIWAPILLILLRLLQGLAFGGEYGGAVVYTAEHAPQHRRGLYVGWIQTSAGFAVFLSLLLIYATRRLLGEDRFGDWGWRIPFLISILLLVVSIWIRLTLAESPAFAKMKAEGSLSRRPLSEAFLEWGNLRLVLIVLFGMTAVQGVVWYMAQFYTQFFLVQVLKADPAMVTLVMVIATGISVPLYVVASGLTDLVGRKPVLLTGMVLACLTSFPLFHGLTQAVNPGLVAAEAQAPITVIADPATCSLDFDPVGTRTAVTACDIVQRFLAHRGISYHKQTAEAGTPTRIRIGDISVEGIDALAAALGQAGYPERADPALVDWPRVALLVLAALVIAVMVYAPIGATMAEIFPTRLRYSSLSLPYHIGSGWFGGFLPAITFSMAASSGNIYSGLWYPIIVTAFGAVVLALCLPETSNRDIGAF